MFTPGIITYNNVAAENIGNFERTEAFSFETWFYQTTAKTSVLISHVDDAPTRRGWLCNVWNFRNIGMVLCSNEATANFLHVRTASSQYSLNVWNHIVFTYNGNSLLSGCKCYINKVAKTLTQVGTYVVSDTIKSDTAKLWVGHSYVYQYFPGRIDETVIYKRVLSASEVSQRYNSGVGTETLFGSAYLQYHFNEINGSSVNDSSGNLRNGITVGSPLWVAGKINNCIQLNGSTQYIQA